MSSILSPDVLEDDIAINLARILAAANRKARESGVDVQHSLMTISRRHQNGGMVWRVNYGPADYIGRRGGDLVIDVNPEDASIAQVLRGQ